ncbi:MAG: ATP-binding protein, partial [Candidatus Caldatribacteriaceae bacterium]
MRWLDRREIIAIKGPRQSGKTTLLRMLQDHLINKKKVEAARVFYFTLEDFDILEALVRDPKVFIRSYIGRGTHERYYFFFDEFHYVKEGGQRLKLLYDLFENVKFIITGSSSLELTGSTSRYLVGRVFSFQLFPFCLEEFFATREPHLFNLYKENNEILTSFAFQGKEFDLRAEIFEKEISREFEEFVRFGGYPEVVKAPDLETKQMILKNIFDTYITKDIIGLLRLGDISTFRSIVVSLANTLGGLFHYASLAADGRSHFRQLKQYLSVLEETYVIRMLRPHFGNL